MDMEAGLGFSRETNDLRVGSSLFHVQCFDYVIGR